MKERAINLNAYEVLTILAGRKTQMRRVIKNLEFFAGDFDGSTDFNYCCITWYEDGHLGAGYYAYHTEYPEEGSDFIKCPFGGVGDRLWVREAWAQLETEDYQKGRIVYQSDEWVSESGRKFKWTSSTHMPRWASRITLEITNIRVERVQDISEEDAIAEGVEKLFTETEHIKYPELEKCHNSYTNYLWHGRHGQFGLGNKKSDAWPYQCSGYKDVVGSFSSLWELNNAKRGYGWDLNPWVWVVEFKRVEE